jgi:hypothetical protein
MKILVLIPTLTLLTACAQVGSYIATPFKSSTELAIEECSKIYSRNHPSFSGCVERTAISIRNYRSAQQSTETVCQPWLNGVRCTSR